jgi:hypothetical protein
MTPKEQAKELVEIMSIGQELDVDSDKMKSQSDAQGIPSPHWYINSKYTPKNKYAKECAIRAVSEIIKSEPRYPNGVDWEGAGDSFQYHKEVEKRKEAKKYWEEVKQEIEKL